MRLILCFMLTMLAAGAAFAKQPEGWDSHIRLKEAADINPDRRIVEVLLEARVAEVEIAPGRRVEAWTYDGGLPGPLIRIEVGSRLIVHFTNNLPVPTTIHWHGLRVPIEMDGVPGISQPEIRPGATFTYDFVVPDAGLFWYHPHVQSSTQVGNGLYGALLVEDPDEPVPVRDELVLVLSDIGVEENGKLSRPDWGGTAGMAFGREGNLQLVNGRVAPTLVARSGALQRWRVVNTAKSRYFQVSLPESFALMRIGGDGGLQESPVQLDTLVLGPGERADVIVKPRAKAREEFTILNLLYNRGYGSVEFRPVEDMFKIVMDTIAEFPESPMPQVHRDVAPLSREGATPIQLDLNLSQDDRNGSFEYSINGKPFWKAQPLSAKVGETQLWTVKNNTPWSHPLHIHGFFFQVLSKDGQPVRPLLWKDTVDVPFKQSIQLLVRFDRPGQWMVHCHILDHAEGGLMTTILVGDSMPKEHLH